MLALEGFELVVDVGGVTRVDVVGLEDLDFGAGFEEALQVVGGHFAFQFLGVGDDSIN